MPRPTPPRFRAGRSLYRSEDVVRVIYRTLDEGGSRSPCEGPAPRFVTLPCGLRARPVYDPAPWILRSLAVHQARLSLGPGRN